MRDQRVSRRFVDLRGKLKAYNQQEAKGMKFFHTPHSFSIPNYVISLIFLAEGSIKPVHERERINHVVSISGNAGNPHPVVCLVTG